MELHVAVRGRVQGVGFRWFVVDIARSLGIRGWVRNNSDGSVEVSASGEAEDLEKLRSALQRGPAGATVTGLDDLGASLEPMASPFAILR